MTQNAVEPLGLQGGELELRGGEGDLLVRVAGHACLARSRSRGQVGRDSAWISAGTRPPRVH